MYEHGIRVLYRTRGASELAWSATHHVDLPGWCAGDAQMAVALYLHGHRDAVDDVQLVDWVPWDGPRRDDWRDDWRCRACTATTEDPATDTTTCRAGEDGTHDWWAR